MDKNLKNQKKYKNLPTLNGTPDLIPTVRVYKSPKPDINIKDMDLELAENSHLEVSFDPNNFSSQRNTQREKTQFSQFVNPSQLNDSDQLNKSSEENFQTYNQNMNNANADLIFNQETPHTGEKQKVIVQNFNFNV